MRRKNTYFFQLLIILTILFLFLISFDIFPILRGPAPYPPEWQWPYQVDITLSRLWFPFIISLVIIFIAFVLESNLKRFYIKRFIYPVLLILGFFFYISLLFYSRGGINILIHRILNPLISGYFTTSLSVVSITDFLREFTQSHPYYPMYAKFHPPFSILFFNLLTFLSEFFTPLLRPFLNRTPTHQDVAVLWGSLTQAQQLSALLSVVIIIFLSLLTMIPLSKIVKLIISEKYTYRSLFLFLFIPSMLLFTPLNDAFMPVISATALYFFLRGIRNNSKYGFFLSGISLAIGALFSLTFLPLFGFFIILGTIAFIQQKKFQIPFLLTPVNSFAFGFLLLPFLMFLFTGYNFFENIFTILKHHNIVEHHRNYLTGLWYAPFDFFLFLGIPVSFFVFSGLIQLLTEVKKNKKQLFQKINPILLAFWGMLLIVIISGSVRVESARIWTPYIPLAIAAALLEMERRNISTKQFVIVLILLVIQVILFQSVLVTVW